MLRTRRGKAGSVGGDQLSNTRKDLTSTLGEFAGEALLKGSCARAAYLKHAETHHHRCVVVNLKATGGSKAMLYSSVIPHYLFEEVHEAWPKAPGFVAVTLQGADGHLSGPLGRHSHHEDCVVHQGSIRLRGRYKVEDAYFFYSHTQKQKM